MTALVDSNVILDLLSEESEWTAWSADALARCAEVGPLVINPIIYAEVAVHYPRIEDLNQALPSDQFAREPIPFAAAFLAGKAFLDYRRRGGSRTSPLPDFLIGAHALVAGYRLLTRDAPRYRTYFPNLPLITP